MRCSLDRAAFVRSACNARRRIFASITITSGAGGVLSSASTATSASAVTRTILPPCGGAPTISSIGSERRGRSSRRPQQAESDASRHGPCAHSKCVSVEWTHDRCCLHLCHSRAWRLRRSGLRSATAQVVSPHSFTSSALAYSTASPVVRRPRRSPRRRGASKVVTSRAGPSRSSNSLLYFLFSSQSLLRLRQHRTQRCHKSINGGSRCINSASVKW
jgi:hypothetical protein